MQRVTDNAFSTPSKNSTSKIQNLMSYVDSEDDDIPLPSRSRFKGRSTAIVIGSDNGSDEAPSPRQSMIYSFNYTSSPILTVPLRLFPRKYFDEHCGNSPLRSLRIGIAYKSPSSQLFITSPRHTRNKGPVMQLTPIMTSPRLLRSSSSSKPDAWIGNSSREDTSRKASGDGFSNEANLVSPTPKRTHRSLPVNKETPKSDTDSDDVVVSPTKRKRLSRPLKRSSISSTSSHQQIAEDLKDDLDHLQATGEFITLQ